jgi:signal transduction histidine kinase
VASVAITAESAGKDEIGDVIFIIVVFLIPAWLLGRAVRDRNRRVAELEELGEALATERARAEELAADAERTRIAREMHDVLSHSVGLIALQAGAGERLAATDPTAARDTLRTIATAGRSALDELSGVLEDREAVPDLARMVEPVRAAGLEVDLRHETVAAPPDEVALATRRIVQEALTNVLKHAAARRVVVEVRESPEAVDVLVEDDGTGAGRGGGTGRGLIGMRERAAVYNGELRAGPRAEGGYAVAARLRVER